MLRKHIRVLGIESSCDETAAAVVAVSGNPETGFAFEVQSSVVASQVAIHAQYGGVVPEVAAREHVLQIMPVIERALRTGTRAVGHEGRRASSSEALQPAVDAIAVTAGPGLLPSLAVGVETARALAFAWKKPLIAVNHIEGHVISALLRRDGQESTRALGHEGRSESPKALKPSGPEAVAFPALALIVSGGHTELLLMRGWGKYRCIGSTRDDAAGEAFDKVAKLLGLPYPGGPAVAAAAEHGDPAAFDFPRGMLYSKDFDFSFSGMKTAVRYLLEKSKNQIPNSRFVSDVCASFQAAVVDVLVAKTVRAATQFRVQTVLLGGGVAANRRLRDRLAAAIAAELPGIIYQLPDAAYTGDNAAMIAAAGGIRLLLDERTPWERLRVDPNWELGR